MFYILGGWLGERWGRREVIIVSGVLVAPLSLFFLLAQRPWIVVIVYFLLYHCLLYTSTGTSAAIDSMVSGCSGPRTRRRISRLCW